MSSLRPAARTTAPDGREWEIYAYRERAELPDDVRFTRVRKLFARRSDKWLIEAVSWAPYEKRFRWSIAKERRGQALASVEGQLARGENPMLRDAKQLLY
ncbi:MAG: hypothetical protein ACRDNM_14485 [Gaiellaceae bacterium]